MAGINYDGASLVPDLSQSLRMALGIAQQRKQEEEAKAAEAEALGLVDQLTGAMNGQPVAAAVEAPDGEIAVAEGGAAPARIPTMGGKPMVRAQVSTLHNPQVLKAMVRLNRISPDSAKFIMSNIEKMDAAAAAEAAKQAGRAKSIFTQLSLINDPAERNRFIATSIRDLRDEGLPTDKLESLIGQSPDQQKLSVLSQVISSTDAEDIFSRHGESIKNGLEVQKMGLERDKLAQETENARLRVETEKADQIRKDREEQRKVREEDRKVAEFERQGQQAQADEARKQAEERRRQNEDARKTAEAGRETAKATAEVEKERTQKFAQATSMGTNADLMNRLVSEARALNGSASTGWMARGAATASPTGDTAKMKRLLDTIKSKIGLSELINIKAQGGTLGALSDAELAALQNSLGNLDYDASAEERAAVLDQVAKVAKQVKLQAAIDRAKYAKGK